MYCEFCGAQLPPSAEVCVKCGRLLKNEEYVPGGKKEGWTGGFVAVAVIATLVIPIAGIIIGIIGIAKDENRGKGILILLASVAITMIYYALFYS